MEHPFQDTLILEFNGGGLTIQNKFTHTTRDENRLGRVRLCKA